VDIFSYVFFISSNKRGHYSSLLDACLPPGWDAMAVVGFWFSPRDRSDGHRSNFRVEFFRPWLSEERPTVKLISEQS
jgi:hypothetical protein